MARPFDLEDLPNELLIMILKHTEQPMDFISIVRASPQCRRICGTAYVPLLEARVRESIPPRSLRDALIACNIPCIPGWLAKDALERRGGPDSKEDFLWIVQRRIRGAHEFRGDQLPTLVVLARLCALVHAFVAEYERDVLPLAAAEVPGKLRDPVREATERYAIFLPSERDRVQRAFFKFEALRKVHAVQWHANHWPAHLARPLDGPFVQERAAVFVYLAERTERVLRRVERFLLERAATFYGDDCGRRALLRSYPAFVYWYELETSRAVNFDQLLRCQREDTRRCRQMVSVLTSMGLPFLRYFFDADVAQQAALVYTYEKLPVRNSWAWRKAALNTSWSRVRRRLPTRHTETTVCNGWGWQWAQSLPPDYPLGLAAMLAAHEIFPADTPTWIEEFLRLGLCFWTKGRLERSGVLRLTKLEFEALRCRRVARLMTSVGEAYARSFCHRNFAPIFFPMDIDAGQELRLHQALEYSAGNM